MDEAESLYNTITGTYPDDVEAWFHLGDLLFHSNPLRGRSAAEAREPFERVVRLDPTTSARWSTWRASRRSTGRRDEMLALVDRVLAGEPRGRPGARHARPSRGFTAGDRAAMAAIWRALQDARAITVAIAFADVALYARDLRGAAGLARSFLQVARAPELRALCHIQLAHLALARGQTGAAWEELARAEALDETWGREMRAWFATLPFVPMTEAARRAGNGTHSPAGTPWARRRAASCCSRCTTICTPPSGPGCSACSTSAWASSAPAAEQLEALAELEADSGLVRSLTVELDAAIVRARGRPAEALAAAGARPGPSLWFQLTVASPFFSLASQRCLRAACCEEVGRTAEAAGWYRAIAERSPYELIYLEPARERLAGMGMLRGMEGAGGTGPPYTSIVFIDASLYRSPAATPFGATSSISCQVVRRQLHLDAPAGSPPGTCRCFVPGMGTMSSPWASTQASASCAGVHFFRRGDRPRPGPRGPGSSGSSRPGSAASCGGSRPPAGRRGAGTAR